MNTAGIVLGVLLFIAGLIGLLFAYHLLAVWLDWPRLFDWAPEINSD